MEAQFDATLDQSKAYPV